MLTGLSQKSGLSRAWIIHLIFIKSFIQITNAVLLLELVWSEIKLLNFTPTDRPSSEQYARARVENA
jgi:hypothetical protein